MRFKLFNITWNFSPVYYFLMVIITPPCWIRSGFTDKKWDKKVLAELKNPVFTDKNNYTVTFNGKIIWIENKPYDCVTDYSGGHKGSILPSRATVFKFFDALEESGL